jgi:hypothetical protein
MRASVRRNESSGSVEESGEREDRSDVQADQSVLRALVMFAKR